MFVYATHTHGLVILNVSTHALPQNKAGKPHDSRTTLAINMNENTVESFTGAP